MMDNTDIARDEKNKYLEERAAARENA
jgi:hypothetical protein